MIDRFVVVPAAYVFFLRSPADGDGPADPAHGADGAGHVSEREVLLQLRQGTGYMDGYWATAAAGHVEKGESVYAAAGREAAEELGLTDIGLSPLCAMHRTGSGLPIDERVDYFFTATSWSGEPRIIEPDKCADLRWFSMARLPEPVVPHELEVLQALRAGDVPPILTHGF